MYVPSLFWRCFLGDSQDKKPVPIIQKLLFHNKWRKMTERNQINQVYVEVGTKTKLDRYVILLINIVQN